MLHASVPASYEAHSSCRHSSSVHELSRLGICSEFLSPPCREVSKNVAIFFGIQRGFILSTNPSVSKLFNRLLS